MHICISSRLLCDSSKTRQLWTKWFLRPFLLVKSCAGLERNLIMWPWRAMASLLWWLKWCSGMKLWHFAKACVLHRCRSKCTTHPSRPHSTQVNQALKSLGQNFPLRLVKCSLPWQGWEGTWRLQSRHISIDILAKFNGAFSQCLS